MVEDGRLICVAGPTGTGKTRLGVLLAQKYDGEIVSVDSMQIYRGMTVGTAAPTEEEMGGVAHHMLAIASPTEDYCVARFAREADACIRDIFSRGRRPILVGGTGLYLDAILRGTGFAPRDGEIRKTLQERLETEGIAPLLQELAAVDPAAAARLHPADSKRILRALEVYLSSGKTITAHNEETKKRPARYGATLLALDWEKREDLWAAIDLRVEQMLENGLLDELRALLAAGVPRGGTALQAIGYKELLGVLDGEKTLADGVAEVKLRSRQYAKRQRTWLRGTEGVHWILWEKDRDFARALRLSTEILAADGVF